MFKFKYIINTSSKKQLSLENNNNKDNAKFDYFCLNYLNAKA